MTNLTVKLYISLAHSDADIDRTLEAVEDALTTMRSRA
jgi:glutamate-1-semialdehyde aminotransferase